MLLLIVAFGIVFAVDFPSVLRSQNKRELTIYCVFFIFVFGLCIVQTMGINLPSPLVILYETATAIGLSY